MNVKKTKKFKENHPENYHVHDNNREGEVIRRIVVSMGSHESLS